MEKSIYDLELHECIEVIHDPCFKVMRVASGWIYLFWDHEKQEYNLNGTFVPFDNTFQPQ